MGSPVNSAGQKPPGSVSPLGGVGEAYWFSWVVDSKREILGGCVLGAWGHVLIKGIDYWATRRPKASGDTEVDKAVSLTQRLHEIADPDGTIKLMRRVKRRHHEALDDQRKYTESKLEQLRKKPPLRRDHGVVTPVQGVPQGASLGSQGTPPKDPSQERFGQQVLPTVATAPPPQLNSTSASFVEVPSHQAFGAEEGANESDDSSSDAATEIARPRGGEGGLPQISGNPRERGSQSSWVRAQDLWHAVQARNDSIYASFHAPEQDQKKERFYASLRTAVGITLACFLAK